MEFRELLVRRDVGYAVIYDDSTAKEVQKMFKLAMADRRRLPTYFKMLDRVHDDQTVFNDTTKRYFEPEQLGRTSNKLVNEGLTRLSEMAVGKSSKRFGFYGIGESEQTVNVRDDRLYEHVARVDILQNSGILNNRGTTQFYSVFFPKTTATLTVRETGIFDSINENNDTMLLRSVFDSIDQVTHTKDVNLISVGHVVYSGSV